MELVVRVILEDSIRRDIRPEISKTKFCTQAVETIFSIPTVETIFVIFMELTGNGFDFLDKRLSSLYEKAEMLIEQDGDPESLNELLCEINDTYSLLKKCHFKS